MTIYLREAYAGVQEELRMYGRLALGLWICSCASPVPPSERQKDLRVESPQVQLQEGRDSASISETLSGRGSVGIPFNDGGLKGRPVSGGRFVVGELRGSRFELESKTGLEIYSFGEEGLLGTTLGTVGGPVTSPILKWEVLRDGRIRIDDTERLEFWRKMDFDGSRVTVEREVRLRRPAPRQLTFNVEGGERGPDEGPFDTPELVGATLSRGTGLAFTALTFERDFTGGWGKKRLPTRDQRAEAKFVWSIDEGGELIIVEPSGDVTSLERLERIGGSLVVREKCIARRPVPLLTAVYRVVGNVLNRKKVEREH